MPLIRKFWWLALIAGGWLLVHHAHADTLTDAAKQFEGELLKMRRTCVAAVVTWNGTTKFKNIARVFGTVDKFERSKSDVIRLVESDVQVKMPSVGWITVDVTCNYNWIVDKVADFDLD